jgi:hypothetical protein
MALMGLTTGLQVAGQYQQSRAQAAAYTAQAEAAEQNAKIQNRKGEQIAENAAAEQRKLDNRMRLIAGQQNAQAGASGLVGGMGSALDVYNASMQAWSEDSTNLLENQRNTIYDNYVNEVNFRNQGNSYRAQASAAKQAGNMAIAGTLLGAASSMIGMGGGAKASADTSTATVNTPTAAGWQARGMDAAFGGMSGYSNVSTGAVQGLTQAFGPAVKAYNPYSMATNGVYWKR